MFKNLFGNKKKADSSEEFMETMKIFIDMPRGIKDKKEMERAFLKWLSNRVTCFHCKAQFTLMDGMNSVHHLNPDEKVLIACPHCKGTMQSIVSTDQGDVINIG